MSENFKVCKRRVYLILLTCLTLAYQSQSLRDSSFFKSRLILGKLSGPFFAREFRPDHFGKVFHAFDIPAFLETSQLRNSRAAFKRSGLYYYKFERYCKVNNIAYNRKALSRYRRNAAFTTVLYTVATFHPILFVLDAWDYSSKTGYYKVPQVYFKSKRAPLLWAAWAIEWTSAFAIKNRADKRLRERIFKSKIAGE